MAILSLILGVLMILAGFSCMFTPVATFLATGYYIGIMMLVYGIMGIVRGIRKEADTVEIVLSVLAAIVGLISLFRPGATLVFDGMMIFIISAWILLQGIGSIILAIRAKKAGSGWVWGLFSGILGVVLGIYSFMHPQVAAVTAGFLIGFYFVETGINMIVLSAAIKTTEE